MKKIKVILSTLFLVALTLQPVTAAYFSYYDSPYNYGGRAYFSLSDRPPRVQFYYWDWDSDYRDWLVEYRKVQAAKWVVNSYNARYDITSGKSSGDAFCQRCKINLQGYWGQKPAYNFRTHEYNSNDNYYYKPIRDSRTGIYNWRF
jgi:hypothetical protein